MSINVSSGNSSAGREVSIGSGVPCVFHWLAAAGTRSDWPCAVHSQESLRAASAVAASRPQVARGSTLLLPLHTLSPSQATLPVLPSLGRAPTTSAQNASFAEPSQAKPSHQHSLNGHISGSLQREGESVPEPRTRAVPLSLFQVPPAAVKCSGSFLTVLPAKYRSGGCSKPGSFRKNAET